MSKENELPKLNANFKNKQKQPLDDPKSRYEAAVDEYKLLLEDKTHPQMRTNAYNKNVIEVFNRLLIAADNLDEINPGSGVFGLIILALRASLALKDKNIELQVKLKEQDIAIKKLEKR